MAITCIDKKFCFRNNCVAVLNSFFLKSDYITTHIKFGAFIPTIKYQEHQCCDQKKWIEKPG